MAGGIFGRLRAIVAAAAANDARPSRELFVDEDEYGAIEVLPAAIADWCRDELAKIAAFADAHRAPGGMGWTDIYLRPPAPKPLAEVRMPLAATVEVLGARFPPFERVVTGSTSTPEPIRDAQAFGPSPLTAIVVIGDAGSDNVQSIFMVMREGGNAAADMMVALAALPSPEPLIVIDWPRGGLARL